LAQTPKNYGSQQIEIRTRDLQRDINAGRVSPETTEIVPPQKVVEVLQQKVDEAQAKYNKNPSGDNLVSLDRAKEILDYAKRDGECLIKGCVPKPYTSGPIGTPTPISPPKPKVP